MAFPEEEIFLAGQNITLSGMVNFDPSVDTPLTLDTLWTKTDPISDLMSDEQAFIMTGPVLVQESPLVYETNLTIFDLNKDSREDSGDYELVVNVTSDQPYMKGITATATRSIVVTDGKYIIM